MVSSCKSRIRRERREATSQSRTIKFLNLLLFCACADKHQVVRLHLSCGLDTTPEWVIYNEFVLTTANVRLLYHSLPQRLILVQFIRTVTEVRPDWLLEYASQYFDPTTFPENSETRRALQRVINKVGRNQHNDVFDRMTSDRQKTGKYAAGTNGDDMKKKKKRKAEKQ